MKLDDKITILEAFIVVICILFSVYIWFSYKNIALLITVQLFCVVLIVLYLCLMYVIKKYMEHTLDQLSRVISSIIDMDGEEVFSVLEDDMLSKLQSQVIKLTSILKAQNTRIKEERDEIASLISDISHQLKTPLSNLKLYYELLQDASISKEEYIEFSQNLKSQIEKLSFLLESMIKMSRLEGGIIELTPDKTSLNDVCLTAIKQAYQGARVKNVEIKFNAKEDIILRIDKNWTTEAIFNLIDNAVKYTDANGTIVIETICYEMYARVDVADNGIGMDEKEINNIFKRFYRGENTKNEEGVGLGLYLTREIVSKQNGYIKVKSKALEGSVFSIFLSL